MNRLLTCAFLCLPALSASAASTSITLQPGDSVTITAAGGTTPVPPTPPGPPTWNGQCLGIQGIDETKIIDLNWDNPPARIYPWDYGGMSPRTAIVMRFNTGSRPLVQYLGRINTAEWSSNPSTRVATLSLKPCDFGLQPATAGRQEGQSINIQFQIQGSTLGGVYYPSLPLNTTAYYNLRNVETPSCAMNNVCDVAIDVHKPSAARTKKKK